MASWGSHRPHGHLSPKNLLNATLVIFVLVVWVFAVDALVSHCTASDAFLANICENPVASVSLLQLFGVSLLFWLIGLCQRSFWLIDPFWVLIPFMITYAYIRHASILFHRPSTSSRFICVVTLLVIWGCRMLHTYFRREGWKFGEREDWRYTLLAMKYGKHWWWLSFWMVGVLQQMMLTGLTLPVYAVLYHPSSDGSVIDSVAVVLCAIGIALAFSADNDLYLYMTSGPNKPAILNTGLWRFCRHPNYFGEQLFWWSLCLFSLPHGDGWTFVGPLFNTIILIETKRMTEERMLRNWDPARVALYRRYQKTTSAWILWPYT